MHESKKMMHTTVYLVASFTAENHFDTHGLYFTTEEIHWSTSANCCNVIGLQMINDVWNGIEPFLHGEDVFVMNCTQKVGYLSGGQ